MSNNWEGGTDKAAPDNQEMKGLILAAAMVAGGGESDHAVEAAAKRRTSSKVKTNNMISSPPGDGKTKDISAARARRLEQNRRAAIESRRRKKVMIEELQRSVSFYTKANETLRADNAHMEQRLCLAKQRVAQRQMGNAPAALKLNAPLEKSEYVILKPTLEQSHQRQGVGTAPALLKAPPKGCNKLEDLKSGSPSESIQNQNEQQQKPVFPLAPTIPFPDLTQSVSSDQVVAQLTATQAMYESLGYPSAAARNAASTFSQFVRITGNTPMVKDASDSSVYLLDAGADTKTSAAEPTILKAAQLPSEAEVGRENFVESLKEFAKQQTEAANAAAAAANAAIQALNWYTKMMANGTNPQTTMLYIPPVSMPSMFASPAQSASAEEEELPPLKKQKS